MARLTVTTLRTVQCYDEPDCPGFHRIAERPGKLYGVATLCTDAAVVEALGDNVGSGELLWEMPDLIPEVQP